MKHLNFALHHITSLREELSRGFARVSLSYAAHRRPISVTLWRPDGTSLQVRCRMHDVAERTEYGVLEFDSSVENGVEESVIDLADDLLGGIAASKLVVNDDLVECESGLAIRGVRGSELIVVAGAYPYTLAVSVAGAFGPFEPEFPLDKYNRVVIA